MNNVFRIVTAMILIVGAGLVHGAWTNRWGAPPALAELASRVKTLPLVLGDWTGVDREMEARVLAMAGAVGNVSRVYTSTSKGVSISVMLLTGLPGDISTHTPDACYPGAGYSLGVHELYSRKYGDPEQSAQFQTAIATKGGASPSTLRIFWAWHGSKGWLAPEEPRWTFGAEPMIAKLYLVRETGGTTVDPKNDPCNELMTLLLPELDRLLVEGGHAAGASPAAVKP